MERNEIIHSAKAELDDNQRAFAARTLARVVLEDALGVPVAEFGDARRCIAAAAAAHAAGCLLKKCP